MSRTTTSEESVPPMSTSLPDKVCTKCLISKPLDDFYKKAASKDGYQSSCKDCFSACAKVYLQKNVEAIAARRKLYYKENAEVLCAYQKIYRQENVEAVAAYQKIYRQENVEAVASYSAVYYRENAEAIAAKQKLYNQENAEAIAAQQKIYRKENKEAIAAQQKIRYQKNPDAIILRAKAYYKNNAEACAVRSKIYNEQNPEKGREASRRRRARRLENVAEKYTTAEVLELYGTDCHICGLAIDLDAPRRVGVEGWQLSLNIDHLRPISKQGADTLENTRPSHGICNLRKGSTWD
jgi:5-methylcytosine-specific restriction endonuclease McrA